MSARRVPGRRRRGGAGRALRSLLASSALLVRRRAPRDGWLLLASWALVMVSATLAVAGPRSVLETVDGGARDAVAAAGTASSVDVRASVGDLGGATALTSTETFLTLGEEIPDRLPPALAAVHTGTTVSLVTSPTRLLLRNGVPDSTLDDDGEAAVAVARLGPDQSAALTLVDGRMPGSHPDRADAPVEVVLSAPVAEALDVAIDDRLTVLAPFGVVEAGLDLGVDLLVVGVVAGEPAAPVWETVPEVWAPLHRSALSDRAAYTRGTVLAADDGMAALGAALGAPSTGVVRLRVDPEAFSTGTVAAVTAEVEALESNASGLLGVTRTPLSVQTRLDDVLAAYPPQARAALAQMSVVIAGVVGVAAVVMVLLSRLLVARRSAVIALERARGASVPAVALRLAAESVPLAVLGVLVGVVLAERAVPGTLLDPLPAAVVLVVAALAAPLQGAWLARRAWTGRREPANRQDRAALAKRRAIRRLVLEAGAVALAAGAAFSLRSRGLLQTTTEGTDPFLAAAPLLVAVAVTALVLRVYPWSVRAVGALGRRTRGVLGLLGAVRAQRAVAPLPLLALTLGAAVAVAGGLLVETVRTGQETASWERVGADVRIDATINRADAAALAEQPGVTAVGSAAVAGRVPFDVGTGSVPTTVVAVDAGYADVLAASPEGPRLDLGDLRALADLPADGAVLPVVSGPTLAARMDESMTMYYRGTYVRTTAAGTTDHAPLGFLEPPFVFVDLDLIAERREEPAETTVTWVTGPGAEDAVATLSLPPESVVSRAGWLAERRGLALHDGVEQMMVLAVVAGGLLCVVALTATVLAGARERGRALSMLRTLGMRPRLGWWLALAELAPVVLAAVVGGVTAGVAVVVLLAPALGLDVLAGGLGIPEPAIAPTVIVGLAAAAVGLLVLAAAVEVLAHRRDRLSDVLRVGETA